MPSQEHLEDLTNDSGGSCLPSPVLDAKQTPSLQQNAPRRILRSQNLDSSETFPSEHDSICDAEPVQSEKEESLVLGESEVEADPNLPPLAQLPSSQYRTQDCRSSACVFRSRFTASFECPVDSRQQVARCPPRYHRRTYEPKNTSNLSIIVEGCFIACPDS